MASKNKFKFLNGSLPIPHPFDSAHEARERCNNLVHSRIVNYVSPCIAQSVIYAGHASEVWRDLKEIFLQGDLVGISELQQEISG